jgi:hypothetical protein
MKFIRAGEAGKSLNMCRTIGESHSRVNGIITMLTEHTGEL